MPGGVVENATACYQPERGIVRRAVNRFRGNRDLAYSRTPVTRKMAVSRRRAARRWCLPGPGPRAAGKDAGPQLLFDVALDTRRRQPGRASPSICTMRPARARDQRRYLYRPVGVEPEVQHRRVHPDGRDGQGYRLRTLQRGAAGRRAVGARRRGRRLRRVHLGRHHDAHGREPAHDEQRSDHPGQPGRTLTGRGGRAYPVSGHEPTTRKPAMRGHLASPMRTPWGRCPPSLIFACRARHWRLVPGSWLIVMLAGFLPGVVRPAKEPKAGHAFSFWYRFLRPPAGKWSYLDGSTRRSDEGAHSHCVDSAPGKAETVGWGLVSVFACIAVSACTSGSTGDGHRGRVLA